MQPHVRSDYKLDKIGKQGTIIGTYKTKAIQVDLGIFWHIQLYSDIFRDYSGIFKTLHKPGLFRNRLFLEPCQIEIHRHI